MIIFFPLFLQACIFPADAFNRFFKNYSFQVLIDLCEYLYPDMPSLKRFTKELPQEIMSYLTPFPSSSSSLALRLATLTFTKTRFCSHVNFISRCLKAKVIPKGFQSNFHASNISTLYLKDVKIACTSFSRNVMRATIRAMSVKLEHINKNISNCISQLSNTCPSILANSIRLIIHSLNSKLFHFLKDVKTNKFVQLTGVQPKTRSSSVPTKYNVVSIPQDLPLSQTEKSILGRGLNFVPLFKKTDEFTVKEDTEKFLRRVKLKAHFHDKEQASEDTERHEFKSLKNQKSNWTPQDDQFALCKSRKHIQKIQFGKTLKFSNLSKEEWQALKSLKTRTDVVIKAADKGGAVVVCRTDLFKKKHFGNSRTPNFTVIFLKIKHFIIKNCQRNH